MVRVPVHTRCYTRLRYVILLPLPCVYVFAFPVTRSAFRSRTFTRLRLRLRYGLDLRSATFTFVYSSTFSTVGCCPQFGCHTRCCRWLRVRLRWLTRSARRSAVTFTVYAFTVCYLDSTRLVVYVYGLIWLIWFTCGLRLPLLRLRSFTHVGCWFGYAVYVCRYCVYTVDSVDCLPLRLFPRSGYYVYRFTVYAFQFTFYVTDFVHVPVTFSLRLRLIHTLIGLFVTVTCVRTLIYTPFVWLRSAFGCYACTLPRLPQLLFTFCLRVAVARSFTHVSRLRGYLRLLVWLPFTTLHTIALITLFVYVTFLRLFTLLIAGFAFTRVTHHVYVAFDSPLLLPLIYRSFCVWLPVPVYVALIYRTFAFAGCYTLRYVITFVNVYVYYVVTFTLRLLVAGYVAVYHVAILRFGRYAFR